MKHCLPSMAQELQVSAAPAVWFANRYLLAALFIAGDIFAALVAFPGYRPGVSGRTPRLLIVVASAGCALATTPGAAHRHAGAAGDRRCGNAQYRARHIALRFSGATAGAYSRDTRPAYRFKLRHRAGTGRHDPAYFELAMAVCNKRAPRYRRLSAGGESAPAADS